MHPVAPQAAEGQVQRWYGVDINFYNQLPYFAWEEIVNMTGAPLTVVQATGAAAPSCQLPDEL